MTVPKFTSELSVDLLAFYTLVLLTLIAYMNAACRNPGFVTPKPSPATDAAQEPGKVELSITGPVIRLDSQSHFTESSTISPGSPMAKGGHHLQETLTEECISIGHVEDPSEVEIEQIKDD